MIMDNSRSQLMTRKNDLLDALRLLDLDRAEGTVDEEAYRSARRRFEGEAAAVLQRLDALPGEQEDVASREGTRRASSRARWGVAAVTAAVVLAAIIIFLVEALRPRVAGGPITGNGPAGSTAPAALPSSQLLAAQRQVRLHRRSLRALLNLGTAYMNAGETRNADQTFQQAIALAPRRPEAATMHALLLGAGLNRPAAALSLLRRIEHANPGYARAWLVDGLLSARRPGLLARAIIAYQRFLALDPKAPVAPEVRTLVARLEKAARR